MPSVKTKVTSTKKYIHNINVDDPSYQQELLRPANIKEDVKLMDARKRVSLILQSKTLRRELEEIIKQQLCSGPFHDTWDALHYLSDLYVPQAQYGPATASIFTKGSLMPALPINDILPLPDCLPLGERILRCKVASLFRLVDIFGWVSGFNGNISMRINSQEEGSNNFYLINPLGLLFHEITATSLSKINGEGDLIDGGSTGLSIDKKCWAIHRAIHRARDDIRCVLHLNTSATIAISNMECGLLPLSQESMIVGKSAIYDPLSFKEGDENLPDESSVIGTQLGSTCHLLFVKNFGLFVVGCSVEECWHYAFNGMTACQTQINLCPVGIDKIHIPSQKVQDMVFQQGSGDGSLGVNMSKEKFEVGELEFQALMRQLDQVGYRTGYFYRPTEDTFLESDRQPEEGREQISKRMTIRENLLLSPVPRVADDGGDYDHNAPIDIPPSKSSVAEKKYTEDTLLGGGRQSMTPFFSQIGTPFSFAGDRSMGAGSGGYWLNTPNSYVRELKNEVGSPVPTTYTHWEESHDVTAFSVPQKIETPNQFAPQGSNPKELRNQQTVVKNKYFTDEKQSGPTSKLLVEDITDEEAAKLQDARQGRLSGDHVVVVGAVSKAIIKKEFRHNAAIYQSVYATNPFNSMAVSEKEAPNTYQVTVKKGGSQNLAQIQEEPKAGTNQVTPEEPLDKSASIDAPVSASTPTKNKGEASDAPGPSSGMTLGPISTSGAEVSFTDTDVEGDKKKEKKKKKGGFKMPSFSRKSKHQHPK